MASVSHETGSQRRNNTIAKNYMILCERAEARGGDRAASRMALIYNQCMRTAQLFVTCLVDTFLPEVGEAMRERAAPSRRERGIPK